MIDHAFFFLVKTNRIFHIGFSNVFLLLGKKFNLREKNDLKYLKF